MQSSQAKGYASSVMCAATLYHFLSIACSRRKTGREILDEQQPSLRLQHRLPLPLPALLGVGPAPGCVAYMCAQDTVRVVLYGSILGGSHLQGCPLDPVLSWDGLGRPWDGMQPCRVTRWPGPGSQRRSVAGLQSGRARVGGVCHNRASSVGCLYPMPDLLGPAGPACGGLLARPSSRCSLCLSLLVRRQSRKLNTR